MNLLSYFFALLAVIMFVVGIIINYYTQIFPEVVVRLFRYGRANISKRRADVWSRLEVPKSWFGYFYLYAVIFQASVFYSVSRKYFFQNTSGSWLRSILSYVGDNDSLASVNATTTVLVTLLFLIHLNRRLLETWFVSIYSGTKMNFLHFGLGFLHYTGASLSLIASSPGFSSKDDPGKKDFTISFQELTPVQFLAICIFVYGNYQQYLAHQGYADLRKGKDKTVTTHEHKIPRGGLFDKISCPNYWAEIIIYSSLALVFGFQNNTWNACTLWVISNQVIAGIMNHKWYEEKFGDSYPKSRKAVIPYLW